MGSTIESKVMRDLEKRRAEQAKKMEGKSIAEQVRLYNEAADSARKEFGLTPSRRTRKSKKNAA